MNLLKAAELLKGAPEGTLKQYLANPNGEFPEYLVASEIARRDDMRKRYAAESQGQPPKASIIEELLQRDRASLRQPTEPAAPEGQQMPAPMPPTAQGLGSVEPPPDMQMTPPPMMAAAQQPEAPQQFYDGGVVALAGGGGISDVADVFNEYMRPNASSNEQGYRVGVSPSIPVGEGSIDLNAAAVGHPGYSGYQGRVGASYPVGEGRISAGLSGLADKYAQRISGYDVGYEDEANRARLNMMPTPRGTQYNAEYMRQLSPESSIGIRGGYGPMGGSAGINYTHRFAHGGEVQHFANKGAVQAPAYTPDLNAFNVDPSMFVPKEEPQVGDIASFQSQFSGMLGPSATEGYQDTLAKQRAELEARKKNYLPDFLIRAGLGMAASKTPRIFQAAAEGLAGGFEDYKKSKEADAAAERALVDSEFKFKAAKRAEDMGLLGLSRQAYSDAKADQRSYYEAKRSGEALRLQSEGAKDAARRATHQFSLDERQLMQRSQEMAAAAQRHKETMAMEERRIQAQIERDKAVTPDVQIRAAGAAQNARDSWMKTFISDPSLAPSWYTDLTTNINTLTGLNRQRAIQELQRKIDEESGAARILNIAGINTGAPA